MHRPTSHIACLAAFGVAWLAVAISPAAAAEPAAQAGATSDAGSTARSAAGLADALRPLWGVIGGSQTRFSLEGHATIGEEGDGQQRISIRLERFGVDDFDLDIAHPDYAAIVRRRAAAIAIALPKHRIVHLGEGTADDRDHLEPAGIFSRLISPDSVPAFVVPMLRQPTPDLAAGTAAFLLGGSFSPQDRTWRWDEEHALAFSRVDDAGQPLTADAPDGRPRITVEFGSLRAELTLGEPAAPSDFDDWPGFEVSRIPREEIERQLARGARRALEIVAPGPGLTDATIEAAVGEHGSLEAAGGLRLAVLSGTPEEIGTAHGELLATEAWRCIDSVLHVVGTVETVRDGRWFRHRLEEARDRLEPHIPERHVRETAAIAAAIGCDPDVLQTVNVFPELFHCSGFAVTGSATADGSLYHGRVLDYMTKIGLQDSAVVFVVAAEGRIPFVNVGYAGFTGSVSGMNERGISLGEMGGGGEGQWDGVPMATLMRRALEECRTLDEVTGLWEASPRTCEYYYVFADGKSRQAVGVAATPERIEFVPLGGGHELLGEGITDCLALSAGDRLKTLRSRIAAGHGRIDEAAAIELMSRPVAMTSNLHNVLFVPEDLVLHVAHASHGKPAAERPSVRIDLAEKLASLAAKARAAAMPPAAEIRVGATFQAADSLSVDPPDAKSDARACLAGLCWTPGPFEVRIDEPWKEGELCVTFPSPRPLGHEANDTVAMEWYLARDEAGQPRRAPACVVVHESGRRMDVGRLIARGLNAHGIHTFLIHLPWYGRREPETGKPSMEMILPALSQGIADVRRARDAVAALPVVDAGRIAVQGTSLGGFVTATAAGLDHGFDRTFILLAGGDLAGIVKNGRKDAATFREALTAAGMTDERIAEVLGAIEPLRLAHRLAPGRTWLYSGLFDDVVPPEHSQRLAEAAGLSDDHHLRLHADHYSGMIYLPVVLAKISGQITAE
jgi:dienelactone hydrolase